MFSYKQIHVDLDTIVSFVIQSGHVSEDGVISVSCHVNYCPNIKNVYIYENVQFKTFKHMPGIYVVNEMRNVLNKPYRVCFPQIIFPLRH